MKKTTLIATLMTAMAFTLIPIHPFAASAPKTIDKGKAIKIALEDAKVKKKELDFIQVNLEYDDGIEKYEVDFDKGNQEYDYDIDAKTGEILDVDTDHNAYVPVKKEAKKKTGISKKEAINIALKDQNFSKKDVRHLDCELDENYGKRTYEVEYKKGGLEYHYDIAKKDGKILDSHTELEQWYK